MFKGTERIPRPCLCEDSVHVLFWYGRAYLSYILLCLSLALFMSLCQYIFLYFDLDVHTYISYYNIHSDIYLLRFYIASCLILCLCNSFIYLHTNYLANFVPKILLFIIFLTLTIETIKNLLKFYFYNRNYIKKKKHEFWRRCRCTVI